MACKHRHIKVSEFPVDNTFSGAAIGQQTELR
jgi:hypothetical protein